MIDYSGLAVLVRAPSLKEAPSVERHRKRMSRAHRSEALSAFARPTSITSLYVRSWILCFLSLLGIVGLLKHPIGQHILAGEEVENAFHQSGDEVVLSVVKAWVRLLNVFVFHHYFNMFHTHMGVSL